MLDIRSIGLVGGVQLAPNAEGVGKRGFQVFEQCFQDDLMVRCTGDTIAMSPPLIVERRRSTPWSTDSPTPFVKRFNPYLKAL